MSDLNALFRRRIGSSLEDVITFENLDIVLEKTAKSIPFENLCILRGEPTEMTREGLLEKIIVRNEGGLCYELNAILYFFLIDNGFKCKIVRGTTYNHNTGQWSQSGKTHVAILIEHNGETYLVDTGYGGNLPLKPVPLTGTAVRSANGEFRVERAETEYGNYIFYRKLKYRDEEWKMGYAFYHDDIVDSEGLNEIQNIIRFHSESPFNKRPLITMLTDDGSIILTDSTLTEWVKGNSKKKEISEQEFQGLAKEKFGLDHSNICKNTDQ